MQKMILRQEILLWSLYEQYSIFRLLFKMEDKQQRNLRHYHHQARLLLTERERDLLHDMLKEYQKYHNARQFISDLRSILNTPAKMDLLREIRNLVPPTYLQEFDTLAPYDRMAHPAMAVHLMQDAPVFKRSPSWHGRAYERTCDTQSEDLGKDSLVYIVNLITHYS